MPENKKNKQPALQKHEGYRAFEDREGAAEVHKQVYNNLQKDNKDCEKNLANDTFNCCAVVHVYEHWELGILCYWGPEAISTEKIENNPKNYKCQNNVYKCRMFIHQKKEETTGDYWEKCSWYHITFKSLGCWLGRLDTFHCMVTKFDEILHIVPAAEQNYSGSTCHIIRR